MENLKFLSHVSRVQELHQRMPFSPSQCGFRIDHTGQGIAGVVNKEAFLRLHLYAGKCMVFNRVCEPIPANVAGEVLFPRSPQQIIGLPMRKVGAGGALRCVVSEILE